jgi:hypothetical protein
MLYTKHRKIKLIDARGTWGEFETWKDFGETWGDYLIDDPHYQFVWLKVPFEIRSGLKDVKWIGYEGLKGFSKELLPESFYRRWGWVEWREIFKEKIFPTSLASGLIVWGIDVKIGLGTYLRIKELVDFLMIGLQIGSIVVCEESFVGRVLNAIGSQIIGVINFDWQVYDSYRWGLFETWGDFPNDRWAPLWSIT